MGSESRGVSREGGGPVPGPIIEELLGWESKELRLLYNSRVAVCGLLRAIPPACRHLLMRLLYLPNSDSSPIPYEVARASFESDRSYQAASTQLLDLKIMEREAIGNVISFTLNAAFAENLRKSISMDLEAPFQRVDGSSERVSEEELESFGQRKWESVLHFLVGMDPNSTNKTKPPKAIIKALRRINLLNDTGEGLKITSKGFQFLLRDPYSQVWVLLLELVNSVSNGSIKAKREVLEFLFEMNYSEPGAGYKISDLKDGPVAAMEALVALGLVYKPSRQSDTFFPTKVGRRLVANTGSGGRTDEKNVSASLGTCEIIVETNFRLYAYTTSKLQVDLISMFVHMRTRLPNLAVGHITNESVRMALRNGISAEQIIAYLNAHASSRCRSGRIPSNVSQMIRLWEAEKDRVKTKSGVLFDKFETEEAFDMVEKYAFEMDAKLWSSRILKTLVVADRAADQVKTFIKSNRIA